MPQSKRHRFATEAIMIRRLHAYREARDNAGEDGTDVSTEPEAPDFRSLSHRYDRLLDEWATEHPNNIEGALAYLDLVAAIIFGELAFRFEGVASPVMTAKDFGYALELLSSVRRWLNDKDVAAMVAEAHARLDPELRAAERELADVTRKWDARRPLNDATVEEFGDEKDPIEDRINRTPPATVAGALIKLRHFLNSRTEGLGVDDRMSLQQIADLLEREARP